MIQFLDTPVLVATIYPQAADSEPVEPMSRKKNTQHLTGLAALGNRLKELRLKAGLSQMKLAEAMGFNPPHGYKYIFRLEHGLVRNPTLRTIATLLNACHATWNDLADVMPQLPQSEPDNARPSAAVELSKPVLTPAAPTPPPLPESKSAEQAQSKSTGPRAQPPPAVGLSKPPQPVPRNTRPLRQRLWAERREQRSQRAQQLWTRTAQAEERVGRLLHKLKLRAAGRHAYRSYVRSFCSLLDAYQGLRPERLEAELAKLVQAGIDQQLDPKTLLEIKAICTEVFQTE